MKKDLTLLFNANCKSITGFVLALCMLTVTTNAKGHETAWNVAPVAFSETKIVFEDKAPITGTVKATDADGDRLTYYLLSGVTAQQGKLTFDRRSGNYSYTPAANFYGTARFSFVAADNRRFSNTATVSFTVNAVNDAPRFTKGTNQTTTEDAPAKSIAGWATGISSGPANESTQTVAFVTTNNNSGLFSVQPAVSAGGRLTYTPARNANGVATVSVKLTDNGGTANGGANASVAQTFTITITPVNDAPSFTKGANQTVTEDAAAKNITGWATAISAGPSNENTQALTFVLTNTNNSLFAVQPAVSANGTLTYKPAANVTGTATVNMKLTDNGGTLNGGVNQSAVQSFTIVVTALNDAPVAQAGTGSGVEDGGAITGTAKATDAEGNALTYQLVSGVTAQQGTLTFNSNGSYSYTPAADFNGTASFSFRANDGLLNSNTATITLTVKPVNDAPVAKNGILSTTQGTQKSGTVTATDIDNISSSLTYSLVTNVAHGTLVFNSNGNYSYTPVSNYSGSDAFTFTASDGAASSNLGKVAITVATPPPPATIQVNFQDSVTKTPAGWLRDFGQAFGLRTSANQGSGNTYGWIKRADNAPMSLTPYGLKRSSPADTLLATLMQMQLSTTPEGVWQMEVPNGAYEVTLSLGDGQSLDSKHFINIEGVAAIVNFVPTSSTRFKTATVMVNVSDRLLTVDAIGGVNTKINYIIIKPVSGTALVKTIQFTQTSHSVDVEQGGTTTLSEYIATSDASPVSVQLDAVDERKTVPNWLTVNGKAINSLAYTAGSEITFGVDASNLSIGKYTARVTAAASSYQSAFLDFTLNVIPGTDGSLAQLKVNFQDSVTKTPAGWLRDFGQAFGLRTSANQGSGNTYGWIKRADNTPLDLTKNGRFRTSPADTLLSTLIHMQGNNISNFSGTPIEGIWEAQIANGNYDVTVSVGDGTQTDSKHTINVEGVPAILNFVPTTTTHFKSATVSVTVADGLLTVDAIGGTNTKINYINIQPSTSRRPSVVSVNPENGSQNVSDIASISTSVLNLPNGGINNATLNSTTVYLEEEVTKTRVAANVNGTGGGDAITLVPQSPLKLSTTYVFYITDGVKDLSGASFIPYASTFTTGSVATGIVQNVKFEKISLPNATGQHSSLTIGPDGKLYALGIDGVIKRFVINSDGTLQDPELLYSLQDAYGTRQQRLAIGFAFAPGSTATNLVAYVTHSTYTFLNGPDWDGKLTKLSGANLQNVQDVLVHLPRSAKDHVTNSIAFGPDGALYFTQGSTTAMGDSDKTWSYRQEHLLSAAVLRLDLTKLGSTLPLDVMTNEGGGSYNPYATSAPLTLYATGVRNAFDLVWHSNGELYTATNGSASGGNTPPSVPGTLRPDGTTYSGPVVSGLKSVAQTQRDFLYKIKKGGYYGHPNPLRGQYVMNGGNPTASADPAQVNAYPVGTMPDVNWRGFAFDFQTNKSPNGSIEYKSNSFGGALKGKLMIVRYSQNDDIITLTPGGANNDIVNSTEGATIPGLSGFVDPLDLTEDTKTGNLYVSEYGGSGKITLLRVDESNTTTRTAVTSTTTAPAALRNSSVDSSSGDRIALRELTEDVGFEKTKVYPNPLHQKFTLLFPTVYSGNITLQIVDMAGRVFQLGKSNLRAGGNVMDVDLSKFNLKAGAYLLKIKSDGRNETIKLVIQ